MPSPVPSLFSALCQCSPKVAAETALFDPCLREIIYQQLPPGGRPLSYHEMLRRWALAVTKRREVCRSMEDAEEEYEDSASDIISVVGQEHYKKFLDTLTAVLDDPHTMVPPGLTLEAESLILN